LLKYAGSVAQMNIRAVLTHRNQENKIIKEKLIELAQADSRLMDEIKSVKTNLETTKYELMDKIEKTAATQAESV